MTEERLEEIKDSIDFQKLILDDVYANEGIELYNEVIRLKKEIEKLESKLDARKELCDNLQERIDKATEYIKEYGRDKQLEEEYLMNAYNLAMYNITLLEILGGNNETDNN